MGTDGHGCPNMECNGTMVDRVHLDSNSGAAVSDSAEVAMGSLRIWLKYLERLARGEARR